MLAPAHVRRFVIDPTIRWIGLYSRTASNLMLGTALIETELRLLKQGLTFPEDGKGPALGFWQQEPDNAHWLKNEYLPKHPQLYDRVMLLEAPEPQFYFQLQTNLMLSAAYARLTYWWRPEALPAETDAKGMSEYWGKYYQTESVPEDMARFVVFFNRYCLG